ncbi:MAG: TonB-dependent receptor domain-containing protein, partial [Methylobacter sp.]
LTPSVGAGLATDFTGMLATDRYTETRTYAGYLMDQFELTPEWKLLGGVRYDVFSASQNDRLNDANDFGRIDRQWNPRAGIVWQPTKAQSYYFSYGTSFNPSAEAYSLSEATNTLAPEKNRNFEIGVKYDLFDGRLSATLFFSDPESRRRTGDRGHLRRTHGQTGGRRHSAVSGLQSAPGGAGHARRKAGPVFLD